MIRKPENSQSRKLDFDGSELSAWLFMAVLKHNSLLEEGCYRPIKIRIPASSARIPMTLFGITKRTINGSPCKISQSASNIIPTDMLSLPFLIGRNKVTDYFFFSVICIWRILWERLVSVKVTRRGWTASMAMRSASAVPAATYCARNSSAMFL
jgi:hypothetical protein